jgi:hypothetical protein
VLGSTVSVAGAVVGLIVAESHPLPLLLTLALNPLSVPPPALETETVCALGLAPPAVAAKLRLACDSPIAGGGACTLKVTLTVCELTPLTLEATVTVAV